MSFSKDIKDADDAQIIAMWRANVPQTEIVRRLGRMNVSGSVFEELHARRKRLGLPVRSWGWPERRGGA